MTASGHLADIAVHFRMSALPPIGDITESHRYVRLVPNSNIAVGPIHFCSSPCLAGLRRDRPLHRTKIGDGAHPARQPPTAGGEVAKPALAPHLDGDGQDQVCHVR